MFTSRAEYRTLLRQDNADIRLTEKSFAIGLASTLRMESVKRKKESVQEIKELLDDFSIEPNEVNNFLTSITTSPLTEKQKASKLMLRPNVFLSPLVKNIEGLAAILLDYEQTFLEQAEIQIKYQHYILKEEELVQKMNQLENLIIPDNFNYNQINALSNEALQKFIKIQPKTLGQASRISGVNPSDVQILMVYMGR